MKTPDELWAWLDGMGMVVHEQASFHPPLRVKSLSVFPGLWLAGCYVKTWGDGGRYALMKSDNRVFNDLYYRGGLPRGWKASTVGDTAFYSDESWYGGPFGPLVDWLRWQGKGWWS